MARKRVIEIKGQPKPVRETVQANAVSPTELVEAALRNFVQYVEGLNIKTDDLDAAIKEASKAMSDDLVIALHKGINTRAMMIRLGRMPEFNMFGISRGLFDGGDSFGRGELIVPIDTPRSQWEFRTLRHRADDPAPPVTIGVDFAEGLSWSTIDYSDMELRVVDQIHDSIVVESFPMEIDIEARLGTVTGRLSADNLRAYRNKPAKKKFEPPKDDRAHWQRLNDDHNKRTRKRKR